MRQILVGLSHFHLANGYRLVFFYAQFTYFNVSSTCNAIHQTQLIVSHITCLRNGMNRKVSLSDMQNI